MPPATRSEGGRPPAPRRSRSSSGSPVETRGGGGEDASSAPEPEPVAPPVPTSAEPLVAPAPPPPLVGEATGDESGARGLPGLSGGGGIGGRALSASSQLSDGLKPETASSPTPPPALPPAAAADAPLAALPPELGPSHVGTAARSAADGGGGGECTSLSSQCSSSRATASVPPARLASCASSAPSPRYCRGVAARSSWSDCTATTRSAAPRIEPAGGRPSAQSRGSSHAA